MTERLEIEELTNLKDLPRNFVYRLFYSDTVDEALDAYRKYYNREPTRIYIFAQVAKTRLIHQVFIQHKEIPHDDSASIQQ